jgi:hypothetical protein
MIFATSNLLKDEPEDLWNLVDDLIWWDGEKI